MTKSVDEKWREAADTGREKRWFKVEVKDRVLTNLNIKQVTWLAKKIVARDYPEWAYVDFYVSERHVLKIGCRKKTGLELMADAVKT